MPYILVILGLVACSCGRDLASADAQHKRAGRSDRPSGVHVDAGEPQVDAAAASGGAGADAAAADGSAGTNTEGSGGHAGAAAAAAGGDDRPADAGAPSAGADAAQPPTTEKVDERERANCRFAAYKPSFARDASWVLARCGDDLVALALGDLSIRVLAPVHADITDARVLTDHVVYLEAGELKNASVRGGDPTLIATGVSSILALTSDETRVVFRTEAGSISVRVLAGDEPAVELTPAALQAQFAGLSAADAWVIYHTLTPDMYHSVPLAGGPSRDLGAGLLSNDKRLVASIEAQRAVVRATDSDSEFTWSEPGYTPTAVVAFTRDGSGVVLEDATGALRLISRTGAPTVSLSPTGLLPGTSRSFGILNTLTLVTSGALLRWCQGACSQGFHIIPLSGAAAQHFPFASCQFDRIDLRVSYVFIDPSRERAFFSDPDGNLLLADGAALTSRTLAERLGYSCSREYAWSPDGTKLHYRGCESDGACTLTILDGEGRLVARYANEGLPIYAPHSRHIAFVAKELHLGRLGDDGPLFRRILARPVVETRLFAWADDTTFVYEDADVLRVLHLSGH